MQNLACRNDRPGETMSNSGNAIDWFVTRHVSERRGDRAAFVDSDRTLTYAALADAAARFAASLTRAGIGRERRIGLLMQDTIDLPICFWGALHAGVIPIPINTLLPADQLAYILADSRAAALVVSHALLPAVAGILPGLPDLGLVLVAGDQTNGHPALADFLNRAPAASPPVAASPDEVAFWLYSSGSTGAAKGTKHVHASLRATADTYGAQVLQITADDVMYSAAKLFFAYGLGNSMTFPMSAGASAILLPDRPTPDAVLALMHRFQPTLFAGVPTLYASLLGRPDLGPGAGSTRLRRCISAGEALPEHIGLRWRERVGVDILDGIGSTEMLHIFLSNQPDAIHYGTTGVAVPGYDLRIVDEFGAEVADGDSGELIVAGPSAAEGYWNQRAKSQRTFAGRWTYTGDTYTREADGTYRCGGRADDMMKVGGIWVSPFEVEAALASHDSVLEAAVVGHADADGLIKPRAFVVVAEDFLHLAPDDLLALLKAHVKTRIGPWKYPRWIELVESLPKTATGKIQRFKLRAG
jgi:4-hydroxybenzoate-CoA ligase